MSSQDAFPLRVEWDSVTPSARCKAGLPFECLKLLPSNSPSSGACDSLRAHDAWGLYRCIHAYTALLFSQYSAATIPSPIR